MTVLVVDDNFQMRLFIKNIVKSLGHNVIEADDGTTGVKSFLENNPDVVLMDIRMNTMDGIEAAKIIRQHSPDVKIIMVTDYNDKSMRDKAKSAGANDYVLKENLLVLKAILGE
ncbi:MAG: response regulator [Bacteroidota bacterium]